MRHINYDVIRTNLLLEKGAVGLDGTVHRRIHHVGFRVAPLLPVHFFNLKQQRGFRTASPYWISVLDLLSLATQTQHQEEGLLIVLLID